jgi:REP element-mobilizing transposase RayT
MREHRNFPLAYHITWGTYGTRLHGDDRGTVSRAENQFGDPLIGATPDWEKMESHLLRFPPIILTIEQRCFVEDAFESICQRGKWQPIVVAAAGDHVHTAMSADVDGKDIRKWLKRWLSEGLSARWPLAAGQVWWAECGSVKWVWDDRYLQRVTNYVREQRTLR